MVLYEIIPLLDRHQGVEGRLGVERGVGVYFTRFEKLISIEDPYEGFDPLVSVLIVYWELGDVDSLLMELV